MYNFAISGSAAVKDEVFLAATFLSPAITQKSNYVDYCKASCGETRVSESHFICKLGHKCGEGAACTGFVPNYEYDTNMKEYILYKHNEYRNRIATGDVWNSLGKFPQAANMAELVWDRELEFLAQCWANQCVTRRDSCRKLSEGHEEVGQNIAAYRLKNEKALSHSVVNKLVDVFLDESSKVDPGTLGAFDFDHMRADMFVQSIWARSTRMGCGLSIFGATGQTVVFMVCNYLPAGNVIDEPIYEEGEPCSGCSRRCHGRYKGLCRTTRSETSYPEILAIGYAENNIIHHPFNGADGERSTGKFIEETYPAFTMAMSDEKDDSPCLAPSDKRDGKVQIRSGAKSFPIMNLVWCFSMAVVAL